jgi:hypothetical protein
MIKTLEQLKAILPITPFDWHMQGNYFVVMAQHRDLSKLRALYRLLNESLKPILWNSLDKGNDSIRIFV